MNGNAKNKLNILLLDDNNHNLDLLGSMISEDHFSKSMVKTGESALKVAEKIKFNLAILDINLPDMTGFEVAEKIKSLQPECEIIFCSAFSDREIREQAFKFGGIDYIEKPFDINTAKQRIKNQTDKITLKLMLNFEKERLEKMVSSMADAVVTTDLDDRIVSFNAAAEKIFKVNAEKVINTKFSQFVPPNLRVSHSQAIRNFKNGKSIGIVGRRRPTPLIALNGNGEHIDVELILSSWSDNQTKFVTAIIRDTSNQKVIETSLAELSNALNNSEALIARYSKKSEWVWATDKFLSLIRSEHVKKNLIAFTLKSFNEFENGGKKTQIREIENADENGLISSYLFQIMPANNLDEVFILGTETTAVSSLRRKTIELLDRVRTDELTGCLSRRAFLDDLENGKRKNNFILAMLDVDFFKSINDYYGHEVGDIYLQKLVECLNLHLSECLLARLGGEEFAIAIPCDKIKNVDAYLDSIRQKVANFELISSGRTISRSVSVGATKLRATDDLSKALAICDEALQMAKKSGRNKIMYYDARNAINQFKRVGRPSLESIKISFKSRDIYFDYQGVFDVSLKKFVGYEALIRMRDFDDQIVSPDYFVNEYYHLSNNESEKMSRAKLFRFYIDQLRDKDVGWISYNIRGSDLIGRNFSELIDFCSPKNCGLQICLELSEEEISERIDLPGLRQKLEILKTYGFKIYLDDFGKERSNFHRLVELPFDVIKIDRVLVKNLGFSERSDKLIAFLSALTKEFDMRLIAEGVETDLQAKILLNNNLNLHQGYLYGRPQQIP